MKHKIIYLGLAATVMLSSCKKEFVDRPSLTQPTEATYYTTPEQVLGASALLYGFPWFDFHDKAFHSIGDLMSGNLYTGDGQYSSFMNFTVQGTDPRLAEAWRSFYKVAGWANVLINTLEEKKAKGGDAAILNPGIAEAKFIRGIAYFYIGRVWGAAPIVTDPVELAKTGDFNIPRSKAEDVQRFAIENLRAAEADLPTTNVKGRATKMAAKAFLSKVYLWNKDYENAKILSKEVIDSKQFDLFPDYVGMFTKSTLNNNIESIFALQWMVVGDWGVQSTHQAFLAPNNLLTGGDGWSAVIPSVDVQQNAWKDGDKRKEWSTFTEGMSYPEWKNPAFPNGYVYYNDPNLAIPAGRTRNTTATRSNVLKYVAGPGSNGEPVGFMRTAINTPMLRFAEILLIYAEAVIGSGASTSDAAAVGAVNRVRKRAGLSDLAVVTKSDILKERRAEFAFEGEYFYDLKRLPFAEAKAIIEAQERGTYNTNGTINSFKITGLTPAQMNLPLPQPEINANPALLEAPTSYYK